MGLYLLRKEFPNALSFLKGFLGSTTRAFPGTMPSFSPYITAMKPSVVGSGPIRIPGKSCSSRYLERRKEGQKHTEASSRCQRCFYFQPFVSESFHLNSDLVDLSQFPSVRKSEEGRRTWKTAAVPLFFPLSQPDVDFREAEPELRRHEDSSNIKIK